MNRIKTLVKGGVVTRAAAEVKTRLHLKGRLQRVLLLAACVVALPAVVGCVAYVHGGFPIVIGSSHPYYHDRGYHARPHSSYYCYDCHGYTYFDPYYDYCMNFGFRIDWRHHTSLWRYYSRHHDTIVIKRGFPQYRYKYDYREGPRYKGPVNYEKWKRTDGRTYYSTKEKSTEVKKSGDVKKSTTEKSTKTKTKTTTKTKSSSGKK